MSNDEKIDQENRELRRHKFESGLSKLSDFMSPTLSFFWWLKKNAPNEVYNVVYMSTAGKDLSVDELIVAYEAAQAAYNATSEKVVQHFKD